MSSLKLVQARRIADSRGWFSESWNQERWEAAGITATFVQDNHSMSARAGTIRGIHFQRPPSAQGKLVRCNRGRVLDYAVDLRRGSPTYGRHAAVELSEENMLQLWIPIGFGHGFITLTDDAEVMYKVTAAYDAATEGGVRWDCPALGIDWPHAAGGHHLSSKDEQLPFLDALDPPFDYDGDPLEPF